ncbi:MAG: putative DNA binding domain-containing protein [Acidobacteriia bacterium]|nr:putative DNA binding domain-containing protein [Terriglobia bacterium]
MIEQLKIEEAEANRILALEEGHYLDLKRAEIMPAKLAQAVSAFANTAGGELFIGIEESDRSGAKPRRWRGFADIEEANPHIQVIEAMSPLGTHYRASFLSAPGQTGHVLHLIIFKTKDILYASDGVAYVRRGAQKQAVKGEEALHRLRLDKGIISFEDETLALDPAAITNSAAVIQFMLNVVPTAEPDTWLAKQNLIVGGKPTVAGLLLFADEPQATLPKRSAIKLYRYKTKDAEGKRESLAFDPITIEGPLDQQIRKAVVRTKKLVEEIRRLGPHGLDSVTYPHETLHEIITNAVLHRDYSIAVDVHVRIYDDRIEVESPGRLPGHVTRENILDEQSARNPKIVRLINKFPDPPNKDVGEGLNTAFEAMKQLRLKEPVIEETEHSVTVYIRHTPLASPHDTVLAYLENNDEITNMIARDLTGIRSENSMKSVFLSLKKRGMIEPVPGKTSGGKAAWRKARPKKRKST